ncbi:MAG: thioredoxin family protein [Planctomycetaceae bacterium]|nr:thioredoxin family protein [Planctomycetaceae bacterium]
MRKQIIAVFGSVAVVGLVAAVIMLRPEPAIAAKPEWMTNMQKAQEVAAKENKDLMINFTGSDWCVWCKKLKKEVFEEDGFEKAADKFVFVEMDFPNDKSLIPKEIQTQNEKWSDKFGIQGFPTVVLTDAKGRPYGSMGYVEGGPKPFLSELGKVQKVREERDEAFAKAKKAEGVEKAKLLAAALEAIPSEYHLPTYRAEIDQIIASDDKNEAGLKEQFVQAVKQAEAQKRLNELQQEIQVAFTKDGANAALKIVQDALKDKQTQENDAIEGALKQFEMQLLIKKAQDLLADKKDKEAEEVFATALKKTEKGTDEWLMVQVNRANMLKQADKSKEAAAIYDEMLTVEELVPVQKAMLLIYAAEAYKAANQDKEKSDRIAKADKVIAELKDKGEVPPQFVKQLTDRLDATRKTKESEEKATEAKPAEKE